MKDTLRLSEREEMIGQFWADVRNRLKEPPYGRDDDEADMGIGRYRGDTERRGLGDAVYNQGVERTAEIVDGVIAGRPSRRKAFGLASPGFF